MRTLLLLALLLPSGLFAQNIARHDAERDVTALRRILYHDHPAPTEYITSDSIDHLLRSMTQFEGDSISLHQWEWRIREVLFRIGCGHTYLSRNKKLTSTVAFPRVLPYTIFSDGEQVWVVESRDSSKQNQLPSGAKILKIGPYSGKEIVNRIRRHQPSDGYNQSMGLRLVNQSLYFSYLMRKYMLRDTLLAVEWQDSLGKIYSTSIKAISEKQMIHPKTGRDSTIRILYSTKHKEQYFYYNPGFPDIGVLKITGFKGKGMKMYKKAFKEMNRKNTPYLIIDVRDNLGGSFESCMDIVRYISPDKIKMTVSRKVFRTWRHQSVKECINRIGFLFLYDVVNYHPRWIKKGRMYYRISFRPYRKKHYNGQVYVLANGWSFSAASLMTTYLKEQSTAIVVGQETGGGAMSNNGMQIPNFRLPGSKITIRVPQMNLQFGLGPDMGHGVLPQIPIHYTIDAVRAKRDLEWEAVLQDIQRK